MEYPLLFALGIVLAITVVLLTRRLPPGRMRRHLRLAAVALGGGVVVIPGHGEWIVAPLLVVFLRAPSPAWLAVGMAVLLAWWAVVWGVVVAWRRMAAAQ